MLKFFPLAVCHVYKLGGSAKQLNSHKWEQSRSHCVSALLLLLWMLLLLLPFCAVDKSPSCVNNTFHVSPAVWQRRCFIWAHAAAQRFRGLHRAIKPYGHEHTRGICHHFPLAGKKPNPSPQGRWAPRQGLSAAARRKGIARGFLWAFPPGERTPPAQKCIALTPPLQS